MKLAVDRTIVRIPVARIERVRFATTSREADLSREMGMPLHGSRSAPSAPVGVAGREGRARGRPRRQSVELAVLEATAELLREVGAGRTTINAIAERSHCSKSTIYRRWATRDDIVLDALRYATRGRPGDIDEVVALERELGSTLHAAARRGSTVFGGRMMRAVLPIITRELLAATPIGEAFRRDIFVPIRQAAKARLEGAIERGEVAQDLDRDLVFDMIYGTMLYRLLVGEPIDSDVATALADLVMGGAAGPTYRARSGARS
jgi:AcrR family transcriptional regulator